jgi:uncharacterized alkaline shock family protein YloU
LVKEGFVLDQYRKPVRVDRDFTGIFFHLVGKAASECFGVAGMVSSPVQGLRSAIEGRDTLDKGVRVRNTTGGLVIDLHIVVVYGMNIAAIVKSIVNKVRYTVKQATSFDVAKVNVFVDSMKTDNA